MKLLNMKMSTRAMVKMLLYIVSTIPITVRAQKLSNIQQNSLRAPSNLKIDGKITEWNDKFQAYNHAADIYYTLCNDDENLYLVIHASDPDVLTKITNRGVVFIVNASGKKSDENGSMINYPVFDIQYGNKPYIMLSNIAQLRTQREAGQRNPDSLSKVANKKLHDNEKFIRTNLPGIDTLLSVYNRNGIKAAEAFDSTMAYTCELAVPLKYFNLSIKRPEKFAYHIILPGMDMYKEFGFHSTKNAAGQMVFSAATAMPTKEHFSALASTTDFWGEYTLAKK